VAGTVSSCSFKEWRGMKEAGQPMIKGLGGWSSPKEGIGGAGGSKSGHLGDRLRRQCGQMVMQHRGGGSGA
jgi:hypothetical protein